MRNPIISFYFNFLSSFSILAQRFCVLIDFFSSSKFTLAGAFRMEKRWEQMALEYMDKTTRSAQDNGNQSSDISKSKSDGIKFSHVAFVGIVIMVLTIILIFIFVCINREASNAIHEVHELRKLIIDLSNEKTHLHKMYEECSKEKHVLLEEVVNSSKLIGKLNNDIEKYENKVQNCVIQLNNFSNANARLSEMNDQCLDENQSLSTKIENSTQLIGKLQNDVQNCTSWKNDFSNQYVHLQERNEECLHEKEKFSAEVENTTNQIENLRNENTKYSNEVLNLTNFLNDFTNQTVRLTKANEQCLQQNHHLSVNVEKLTQRVEHLRDDNEQYANKLQNSTDLMNELRNRNDNLSKQVKNMKTENYSKVEKDQCVRLITSKGKKVLKHYRDENHYLNICGFFGLMSVKPPTIDYRLG